MHFAYVKRDTENILLAATDMNIGSCWVAGDKKPYVDEMTRILGAPEGYKLVSLIALGWPKKDSGRDKKRSLDNVLHWETF